MRNCDTLIVGGGHVAVGIALAQGNALICEESEFIDSGFSLTLKSFGRSSYTPQTEAGTRLLACYEALGLFSENNQNCSAFEIGLSRFVLQNPIPVLLKCRVVRTETVPDGVVATILTNAGLETVKARRIIDTRCKEGKQRFSLLFTMESTESLARVQAVFPEGTVEPAFYPDRGALHLPVEGDHNRVLRQVHSRWAAANLQEKILLTAPRLETVAEKSQLTDSAYGDPIAAFEAGFAWGKGAL